VRERNIVKRVELTHGIRATQVQGQIHTAGGLRQILFNVCRVESIVELVLGSARNGNLSKMSMPMQKKKSIAKKKNKKRNTA
jgi:hypothetical protein